MKMEHLTHSLYRFGMAELVSGPNPHSNARYINILLIILNNIHNILYIYIYTPYSSTLTTVTPSEIVLGLFVDTPFISLIINFALK